MPSRQRFQPVFHAQLHGENACMENRICGVFQARHSRVPVVSHEDEILCKGDAGDEQVGFVHTKFRTGYFVTEAFGTAFLVFVRFVALRSAMLAPEFGTDSGVRMDAVFVEGKLRETRNERAQLLSLVRP